MLNLNRCWTEHDIVVIDTETLGLSPEDGVCDVAAVRYQYGREVARFTSFVNPGRPIPEDVTAIHGITDAMVAGAPTLAELAGELVRVARDAVPCAYSAAFDRSFVQHQLAGTDCHAFDPSFGTWLDVLVVVRDADKFVRGSGRHRLSNACERRGIKIDGAHRALPDAVATGELLFSMLERGEIKPCPLGKLLAHIDKRQRTQEQEFQSWLAKQPKREAV